MGRPAWQVTRKVDIPLLKPVILFGVVMATIWAWSAFTEVYIMSQGTDISTGAEIQVMVTRIYAEGFLYFNMGYASAISFVLFIVSLLFVAFSSGSSEKGRHEGGKGLVMARKSERTITRASGALPFPGGHQFPHGGSPSLGLSHFLQALQ